MKIITVSLLWILLMTSFYAGESYQKVFAAAEQLNKDKNYPEASKLFQEAANLAETSEERYNALQKQAYCFRDTGEWDQANQVLEKIIADPQMEKNQITSARLYRIHFLRDQGKLDEALGQYMVLATDEVATHHKFTALVNAGGILLEQKRYDEALIVYRSIRQINKMEIAFIAESYYREYYIYHLQRDKVKQEEVLLKAIALRNKTTWHMDTCIFDLGILYMGQKKYEKAIDTFKLLFTIDPQPNFPNSVDCADLFIGNCYNSLKDYTAAEVHYRKALKSPTEWVVERAEERLKEIVEKNPT